MLRRFDVHRATSVKEAVQLRGLFGEDAAVYAGGTEILGVTYALYENLSPGYGYTAIAAALLAGLEPVAIIATSTTRPTASTELENMKPSSAGMFMKVGMPT